VKLLAGDPDISVLLSGESGTGKELVARAIHYNSPRARAPFVAINCGALPEDLIESELFGHEKGTFTGAVSQKKGLFEVAHRGTLFLDEIGAMPVKTQVKLLRALEEREIRRVGGTTQIPVDLRIISASNQNLDEMVEARSFRRDLYYRLAVAQVALPPLRDRAGDVPLLVNHFLEKFNSEKKKNLTIGSEAMKSLEAYAWPGNVRELEHLVEYMVVTSVSGTISVTDLPEGIRTAPAAQAISVDVKDLSADIKSATKRMTAQFERQFIRRHLDEYQWNVSKAAEAMGLSRSGLHAKMKEYGIP
jgi:two-component system response regulator AtoC